MLTPRAAHRRQAGPADLPLVAQLEHEVFGDEAYPGFFFRQALDLWPELFLVAEEEPGEVVGYVLAAPAVREGEVCVLSAAVRQSRRGRGIAAGLLERLLDRLSTARFQTVWLTVHPDNASAIELYQRLGFRTVGREAGYFGPSEPRLRMQRSLAPGA